MLFLCTPTAHSESTDVPKEAERDALGKCQGHLIGGNVGGIRLQIEDGVSGYLVDSVEDCASRAIALLDDPTEPQIEDAELTIRDPSGTAISTFNLVADMNQTLRSRVRLASRAFRVSGEGIYWFEMTVNGELAAKIPLSIAFSETAEVQPEEE